MIAQKSTRSFLLSILILIFSLAFLPAPARAGTELTIFAAASLTESMNLISEMYKKVSPDVKLVFNFDSSGTLKTQIEQGAECDIFVSAGQKQMDQIDIKADPKVNTKKLDFVMQGTRFNLVSNKIVLIVPKGHNPNGINDFKDAATKKVGIIALGNSDVPIGQYSEEIYKKLGLWEQLKSMNKISYGSTVKEVLSQVAAGAVDCGIVFSTDAAASSAVETTAEAQKEWHRPVTYPAAILKNTKNKNAAAAFTNFLRGPESAKIFKNIGFVIPDK